MKSMNLIADLPASGVNNFWYSYTDSDLVLVFVHGVLSDSKGCWLRQDEDKTPTVYWPALIRTDKRLPPMSEYMGGYYTAIDSGPYEVRNCAHELFTALCLPDEQGRSPVMNKRNIVFICHSTGGIVVRYMLNKERDHFGQKRIGVLLIASPSFGSKWADRLRMIAEFYNHSVGAQLRWGSWSLRELDDDFKNLLYKKQIHEIYGVEAYENHFILHRRFLPSRRLLVEKESAGRYFGEPIMLRDTDHFTSVKPDNLGHPAHQLLVDFLLKNFPGNSDQSNAAGAHLEESAVAVPIDSARRSDTAAFHYLSSRRIAALYDRLPNDAFRDNAKQPYAWVTGVRLDTLGDQGNLENRLRTYQRQLAVILNHWEGTKPIPRLEDALGSRSAPDQTAFYRCVADFTVEAWNPTERSLSLRAEVGEFALRITGSKENFPGLSKTGHDERYEPNSLMPGFFLGHNSMRLLAYVQCERIDRSAKEIFGGALCLVSKPPEEKPEEQS